MPQKMHRPTVRAEFPSFEVSQSFNVFDMIEKEQPDIDQLEANTRIWPPA